VDQPGFVITVGDTRAEAAAAAEAAARTIQVHTEPVVEALA
jgi:phosphoglycolate phosphatase-like HAD superfamily hydrolase